MARFRTQGTAWDGQPWVLVPCLVVFAQQVEAIRPTPHGADGTVAGKTHDQNSPNSDHTVWPKSGSGSVFAIDVGDSEGTVGAMWEALRKSRDLRILYGIHNRRIFSSYATSTRKAWEWGPYGGSNPHTTHAHLSAQNHMSTGRLSATETWLLVRNRDPWAIGGSGGGGQIPIGGDDDMYGLDIGQAGAPVVRGPRVAALQVYLTRVGFDTRGVDGVAGNNTRSALSAWKAAMGITAAVSAGEGKIGEWEYGAMLAFSQAGSGGGLTQAQADGRYSRLGHGHTGNVSVK